MSSPRSDAVHAERRLAVGELSHRLQDEAGAAEELVLAAGLDLARRRAGAGTAVVLLLVLVLVVGRGDAVLQDLVEVGLDVVGIGLLVLVLFVVVAPAEGTAGLVLVGVRRGLVLARGGTVHVVDPDGIDDDRQRLVVGKCAVVRLSLSGSRK